MLNPIGAEWLTLWGVLAVLVLLTRRDRRLLYWGPIWGVGAVLVALTVWILIRIWLSPGSIVTGLSVLVAVGGGCAIPMLICWGRAYWQWDIGRLWQAVRRNWGWCMAYGGLGLLAAGAYLALGCAVVERWGYSDEITLFESDGPLYARYMNATATAEFPVTHKHPLYVLLARGIYLAATLASPRCAPLVSSALAGGVALVFAVAYFRRVTGSGLLGLMLAGGLGISSAHLVFAALPETYAASAVGLILLHWLLAGNVRGGARPRHLVPAAVFAIGMTSTHVFTAVVCFLLGRGRHQRFRPGLRWGTGVVALLGLLLTVQAVLIPATLAYDNNASLARETHYFDVHWPAAWGPAVWNVLRGVLAEGVVGPRLSVYPDSAGHTGLHPGVYRGWLAWSGLAVWWMVLALAIVWLLARRAWRSTTLWAASVCLVGTAGLHIFYGNQHVFLFGTTFVFYLFAIVAHGLARMPRCWAVPLAGILLLVLAANNLWFCGHWLELLTKTMAAS
ncbi:MAG: hypothetical protein ABIG44_05860 [Planctomycetota bacterium]